MLKNPDISKQEKIFVYEIKTKDICRYIKLTINVSKNPKDNNTINIWYNKEENIRNTQINPLNS